MQSESAVCPEIGVVEHGGERPLPVGAVGAGRRSAGKEIELDRRFRQMAGLLSPSCSDIVDLNQKAAANLNLGCRSGSRSPAFV
jgi:hypothetical protein